MMDCPNIIYNEKTGKFVCWTLDLGRRTAFTFTSDSLFGLEKRFSYSRFHLECLFREKYGVGIIAYRNEERLARAKELLATKTVTDVAYTLGYSSIYSFSRAYKNKFGCSPSACKAK